MDISKFHRTVPLIPHHKPYMVVCDPSGGFWVDHCFAFGASSASSSSGMISAAFRDIWRVKGISPVVKIEDDLAAFVTPHMAETLSLKNRDDILSTTKDLDVPWHPVKGERYFVFLFAFIGFLWDLERKRVSLLDEKRVKYLYRLQDFLLTYKKRKVPRVKVESIHGTLCHISFIYPDGRSHLPPISNFMASYRGREIEQGKYATKIFNEIEWWIKRLEDPFFYRELRDLGPMLDFGIFVDASTEWGIGIIIGDFWAAFKLAETWRAPGREICWLETLAVELVAYFLEVSGFHNIRILIHSDNQGTIGAVHKARSPNYWINQSVSRTFTVFGPLFIQPELEYIESSLNPADPISRGVLGPSDKKLSLEFMLPEELEDVLVYV